MIYQLMFAIITPALIAGAFAERMKFSAMVLFPVLWSLVVYAPMAHMVWGKGGLLNASLGRKISRLWISPAARSCTLPRESQHWCARFISASAWDIRKEPMPPHSVVLSFIGACLLWVGWFGFNAGSALAAGSSGDQRLCSDALCRRRRGARLELGRNGFATASPACSAAISGAVAGLVAITPAAGFRAADARPARSA